jgi:anti-sigma regulatory factor (Ser/Thr protein kinase)
MVAVPDVLQLDRELAAVPRALSWIADHAGDCGALPKVCSILEMVVEEVLTNIISYARPEDDSLEIAIYWSEPTPGTVRIEIHDSGDEFNPLEVPDPDLSLDAEEREIGGLGIHLVRRYMDHCEYERRNGRNILAMVRRIHA